MLNLRTWAPRGRGCVLLAESSIGYLIIAGLDPWHRLADLRPYDYVLGKASDVRHVVMFDQLVSRELAKLVRSLCRALGSSRVAWPLRGKNTCRVGLLNQDNVIVAEGDNLLDLGQLVGYDGEHIRTAWFAGVDYGGYRVVCRPPIT